MKSIFGILIILSASLTISCDDSQDEESVNFMISSNHFVKNFYSGETNPSYLIIRSYSSFDSLYGVAVVMGMDTSRLITEEKMEDGFVIAIIYQGNDIHEFDIEKITLKDNQLLVYYTSEVTTPNASWECNCHVTALIKNCDFTSILLFENGNYLPNAFIKELWLENSRLKFLTKVWTRTKTSAVLRFLPITLNVIYHEKNSTYSVCLIGAYWVYTTISTVTYA